MISDKIVQFSIFKKNTGKILENNLKLKDPKKKRHIICNLYCLNVRYLGTRENLNNREGQTVYLQTNIILLELQMSFDVIVDFNYIGSHI